MRIPIDSFVLPSEWKKNVAWIFKCRAERARGIWCHLRDMYTNFIMTHFSLYIFITEMVKSAAQRITIAFRLVIFNGFESSMSERGSSRIFIVYRIGNGVYLCEYVSCSWRFVCLGHTDICGSKFMAVTARDSMRNRRFHEITKYILIKRIAANIIYIFLVWINLWADQARNRNHSWLFFFFFKQAREQHTNVYEQTHFGAVQILKILT